MPDCKAILKQLQSEDREEQREGAFLAGEELCTDATPLLAELLNSGHLGVQEAAESALRKIGGKDVIAAMIPLLRSEDTPVRNLSMDILREIGNQDISSLITVLHDEDPDIRIFISDILGSTNYVMAVEPLCNALLKDPEVNVRYQAAVSLGNLARADAAECLNKALGDEEWVQYAVIEALAKIKHSSSVTSLLKALDNASDLVCSMIIDALGEMGNIKAVPMLLKRMEEAPTALRNKIIKAVIGILGGKSLTLLSKGEREKFRLYMLVALEDEDQEIRDAAISGLAFVGGEDASEAILKIAARIDPEQEPERLEQTIRRLADIGLTKALKAGLDGSDFLISRTAVRVLALIESPEVPLVLEKAFWDKELELQREVITVLTGMADESARDFFVKVLEEHQDGTVLKSALYFLGVKMKFREGGERLFALLDHQYDDVKEAALEACIAVDGEDMAAKFVDIVQSPDPIKRLMAVYALGKLGVKEYMEHIKAALDDEILDIRKAALEAIANLCDGSDDEWLYLVVSRMGDESKEVRLTVIDLMGRCYKTEVIPFLIQALDDADDWVRIRALDALGQQREKSAVKRIVELLDDPNKMLGMKVLEALGNIGGEVAFNALLHASDSDDPEFSRAAEAAIAKIQENQE